MKIKIGELGRMIAEAPREALKYRGVAWFDSDTMTPVYGVQAQEPASGRWANMARNGKPVLFKTEAERDAEIARLRDGQ